MTNQEIKTVGQTIAQETQIGGNTAERVGGVIEGIGEALDNKDAAVGYYLATMSGSTIYVNSPNYRLGTGGNIRVKMPAAATAACTLTVGNANAVALWYNGAAVSSNNSWEAGEIVTIYYDGTRFMASNSQGGGGQFGSGEKIKDILLSQALGAGTDAITSQKGVSDAIFNEIDISSIDTLKTLNDALAPSSSLKPTYYTVTAMLSSTKLKVGSMAVISDNMRHVVTEIMATHYLLDDAGNLTNEHSDAEIFFIYRSVKLSGGTLPDPAGVWTRWRYVNASIWSTSAQKISYDNSQSGLAATDVQEALDEVSQEISRETEIFSTIPVAQIINGNNTWATSRGKNGEFVPVVHGEKYRIVVDSSNSGVIAFMTRATQTGVYYAGGATSRTVLQPSTNVVLTAPDDANYLYYTQIGTTPLTVRVYEIDTIQEEINYIENAVGLNYSVINFVDFNYIINSSLLLYQTSSTWRMSSSMYKVGDDFTIIPTDQTQQYYPVGLDENFHFIRSYADDGMATGTRTFNASSFGVKYIFVAASNRTSMSIDAQTIFKRESIVCAASDTSCKDGADIICPSTDARESLQLAISYGLLTDRKVILMNGRYILNSYITEGGGKVCLVASGFTTSTGETDDQYGNRIRFTTIEGSNDVLGWADGAILKVSDTLYESVTDASPLTVIRGVVTDWHPWENASAISLKNIKVILPSNQKAITCVDFGYTDNARVEHLYCSAFDPLVTPLNVHPDDLDIPIANSECVGVKLTFGANMDASIYEHISVLGFYAGIDFSGEHVIVNSPTAIYCYYGFTFGKYMHSGGMTQQITIINMTEEHNVCLPIYYAADKNNIKVIQILSGNVFWPEKGCQGNIPFDDPRRVAATIPNHNFRGYINYVNSINPSTGWFDTMQSSLPTSYFAAGSEIYMEQKNMAAPPSATSSVRRTWAKGLGMQCFDTTLNKIVFCVVKNNALAWVDANGNTVDN